MKKNINKFILGALLTQSMVMKPMASSQARDFQLAVIARILKGHAADSAHVIVPEQFRRRVSASTQDQQLAVDNFSASFAQPEDEQKQVVAERVLFDVAAVSAEALRAALSTLKPHIQSELSECKEKFKALMLKVTSGQESTEQGNIFDRLIVDLSVLNEMPDKVLQNELKPIYALFYQNTIATIDAIKNAYPKKKQNESSMQRRRRQQAKAQAIQEANNKFDLCVKDVEKALQVFEEHANKPIKEIAKVQEAAQQRAQQQQAEQLKQAEIKRQQEEDMNGSREAYEKAVADASARIEQARLLEQNRLIAQARSIEQARVTHEKSRMRRVAAVGIATGALALTAVVAGIYAGYKYYFSR